MPTRLCRKQRHSTARHFIGLRMQQLHQNLIRIHIGAWAFTPPPPPFRTAPPQTLLLPFCQCSGQILPRGPGLNDIALYRAKWWSLGNRSLKFATSVELLLQFVDKLKLQTAVLRNSKELNSGIGHLRQRCQHTRAQVMASCLTQKRGTRLNVTMSNGCL